MGPNDYQDQAITTAVYPDEHQISYPALGLVNEIGELLACDPEDDDAIKKEMGDVCWYVAVTAYDLGLRLQDCVDKPALKLGMNDLEGLYRNSHWIAGHVKKILRGDDGREEKVLEIQGFLGDILARLKGLARKMEFTIEEVFEANLDKLFDRRDRGLIKGDGDNR